MHCERANNMRRLSLGALSAASLIACAGGSPAQPPPQPVLAPAVGCVAGEAGYLHAKIRGALTLDLAWADAEMECAGGERPDGRGIRVSIGGPPRGDSKRMRLVFGIANVREGVSGSALPTNITVIMEGEQRVFATQGDDKCTVDSLQQERIGALGGPKRSYRVIVRGFCTEPATTLTRGERIVITSFDFVGRADFIDEPVVPAAEKTRA
jgi:hypothetical protein